MWLLLLCGLAAGQPDWARGRPTDEDPSASLQTPYWEVYLELSLAGRPLALDDALQALPDRLQLRMEINGSSVVLELQQNRQLVPDVHTLSYYLPDGTGVREQRLPQVTCYYHGRPAGGEGPWSSLSLCSGLRGTIVLATEQRFSIEPVVDDPQYKHIVRHIRERQKTMCIVENEDLSVTRRAGRVLLSLGDEKTSPQQPKASYRVESEVKYVELVMVADNSEYKILQEDLRRLHVRMLEIANWMDAFYRALNVRVVLVMVEVWSQKDLIPVSEDPAEMLNSFLSWREKDLISRVPHDNAQLLTGVTFKDSSVGMSIVNSICSVDRSGGVTVDHSVSVLLVASTMAHELGHNLGLNHNVADGTCGQPRTGKQWIMTQSTGFMPGLEFSNCSLESLLRSLRQGGGSCLYNVPSPGRMYGKPLCGNLLVEKGEECDCGLLQECVDPCCNASSCQLMPGAECASDGLCCEQCMMKPPGTLCRQAWGECDLPEYCNGASPHCPANVYLQDGEPCATRGAHCYLGECRSLHKQCQDLWGPGSSPASASCFALVNVRGDKYGNCGRTSNGSYLPCASRNVLCGSIQCVFGSQRHLLGANAEIIPIKLSVNGTESSCQGTYVNLGDDVWDSVLVKTGTVCGPGRVCVNQQCRDSAELKVQACRSQCGGHGVCNSNGNCHCSPGWAPPLCGSSGYGGSVDSGPVTLEDARSSFASTVVLVILVILLLTLLLFCYWKRGPIQRRLGNIFTQSGKCQYRVTLTSSQPRPQRPPPPHRTQNTELQLMSAGPQSDTDSQERPDPPSKPLPPDPVQKHCQAAAAQDRPPAPTRPLPEDPLPRRVQVSSFCKPPPPKKPLPFVPELQCQEPLLAVPQYPEHLSAVPAWLAPLPPRPSYTRQTPKV
ncbi:disintegrin and metalloproteinase domain-containing protein 15 isoform X1 [Ranitomeya imitator]|uniref:disintegrin and metalloproteinase domain-containing protein 15 isoform X1 n=2 Tax=Ranitomeya imitator TaxID=111125 RepID=UPI0037E9088B